MTTRSRLTVAAALAMLAAAALAVIGGRSDEPQPTATQARANPGAPLVGEEGSAFAFGRGATDPGAASSSAATKAGGESALDTVGLPDVEPCSLLRDASVDAAIGAGWEIEPRGATGTLQCGWRVNSASTQGGGEVHLTIGRGDLYEGLNLARARSLPGLGSKAVVSTDRSGGVVAVLDGDITVVVALSSGTGRNDANLAALTDEALGNLTAESRAGNG
jgi:hypothetical protein